MKSGTDRYDAVVLGVGGVGSSALYHLASRGLRVVGVDRFTPPHPWGSSHGDTRVIRQAYFEHPDYTPLVQAAYPLWAELEGRVGERLYEEVGVLQVGPSEGYLIKGVLRSALEHRLEVDQLSADEIERTWPALRVAEGSVGVFERRAGFLRVERCVSAYLNEARRYGAELRSPVTVHAWKAGTPNVVETTDGVMEADRLVVAAGPWAGPLLRMPSLSVRRKSMFWFRGRQESAASLQELPCYFFQTGDDFFYGFRRLDPRGVKVAEHSGGQAVADPLTVDRAVNAVDQRRIVSFVEKHLPGVDPTPIEHAVCLYTMSPDENFIVDSLPGHPEVVFAAGLSGHGFKFASVLGKALADLAIDGRTDLPIGFLRQRG